MFKLTLFEGRQMATLASTDFSCLNVFHYRLFLTFCTALYETERGCARG